MELLLLNGAVVVGQGLIGSAISDLYTSLKRSPHHSEFSKLLRDLGIVDDLEIVEKLLVDVTNFKTNMTAIDACTSQIREIVIEIKKEIDAVSFKFIEYQYSNHFAAAYYRYVARYIWNIGGPNYQENAKNLKKLSARLRERVNILIKLISMLKPSQILSMSPKPSKDVSKSMEFSDWPSTLLERSLSENSHPLEKSLYESC